MRVLFTLVPLGACAGLIASFRRRRTATRPARMDAATYAAMVAEAERIASPYRRHLTVQPGQHDSGGEFPEVEALLQRAGIAV